MNQKNTCGVIGKIENALQDEISHLLMNARIKYSITRDKWEFYKTVDKLEQNWTGGNYKKVIALEPLKEMCNKIQCLYAAVSKHD